MGSSDDNGRTALHYAVTQNATECIHTIIEAVVSALCCMLYYVHPGISTT